MANKTFAIITDIHSNSSALSEALDIINNRADVDQLICLGDCFSLGPEPEKTLETLRSIDNCIFIRGNHDRYLIENLWDQELPSLKAWTHMTQYVNRLSKMKNGLQKNWAQRV